MGSWREGPALRAREERLEGCQRPRGGDFSQPVMGFPTPKGPAEAERLTLHTVAGQW